MKRLARLHLAALAVTSAVGAVFGWATARRVARHRPDETLNSLLAAGFEAQRRFVANASHELRTPVTVQRSAVEVALADPAPTVESLRRMALRVHASTLRQERLIDGLLALSTARHTIVAPAPVDLAEAARTAVGSVPAGHDVQVVDDLAPAWTSGDPDLLERLVANLVDNAVRHNHPGGWVRVRTAAAADGVVLEVANSGPRVSAGDAPLLFEPFRRQARDSGFGLGLSIVVAIVESHDGSLSARPLGGGGLEIRVELPAGDRPRRVGTGGSRPPGSASGRGS